MNQINSLTELESFAYECAEQAGKIIIDSLQDELIINYKNSSSNQKNSSDNPVSDIDHKIENLIHSLVTSRFPDHGILGEETDEPVNPEAEYMWIIDPIDGTTNFINQYPLFCVSIGILFNNRPVIGVIWCSTSHLLKKGIYHASLGRGLHFNKKPIKQLENPNLKRRLSAAPGGTISVVQNIENRNTGSAAIELAFVAAGIFQTAQFYSLRIWDLAAGILLVKESGREVLVKEGKEFKNFTEFTIPLLSKNNPSPSLRDWREHILIGNKKSLEQLILKKQNQHKLSIFFNSIRKTLNKELPK
tara:strand:+ start:451 stop:1359 length:909 start_codon:yes stop_codon:yes gene_type:complete